ncbi:MAG: hypothetical protein A3J38_06825 [Gammaproteobacteria bacterium RIFCSPHIGHO2_12_FULL_45_9]|nr:MAG: hypothetical protein A3J38_06825 [Gammaproteobacteria bacterium RIFCSPHIGHO2_12_FULL_45_9]
MQSTLPDLPDLPKHILEVMTSFNTLSEQAQLTQTNRYLNVFFQSEHATLLSRCHTFFVESSKVLGHSIVTLKQQSIRKIVLDRLQLMISSTQTKKIYPMITHLFADTEIAKVVLFPRGFPMGVLWPDNFLHAIQYHFETTLLLIPYIFSPQHIHHFNLSHNPYGIMNMISALHYNMLQQTIEQRYAIDSAILTGLEQEGCRHYIAMHPLIDTQWWISQHFPDPDQQARITAILEVKHNHTSTTIAP